MKKFKTTRHSLFSTAPAATLQRGVTLIELMISMAIGLVVLWGVVEVFASNKETYKVQDSLGELQENGQYALNFISQQIRQTGYYPNPYGGLTGTSATAEAVAFGAVLPVTGNNGTGTNNDDITVSYYTTTTDCIGDNPPVVNTAKQKQTATGLATTIATNILDIQAGSSGRPSLFCNGIEVADGIEAMQILYGEDTDADGLVDTYSPVSAVADLREVMVVKVSILVATSKEINRESDTKSYTLLDTTIGPVGDRRLRRVYSATIRLRNRCTLQFNTVGSRPCA